MWHYLRVGNSLFCSFALRSFALSLFCSFALSLFCSLLFRSKSLFKKERLWANRSRSGLGIRSFAQITQIKWATVSYLLRSFRTNERLWANRSGRPWQMRDCERFAQVAHDTVNEPMSESLVLCANCSFALLLTKNKQFTKKTD